MDALNIFPAAFQHELVHAVPVVRELELAAKARHQVVRTQRGVLRDPLHALPTDHAHVHVSAEQYAGVAHETGQAADRLGEVVFRRPVVNIRAVDLDDLEVLLAENHPAIRAWIDDSGLDNVLQPLQLDVCGNWPKQRYDLLFSANTLHMMSAFEVEQLFSHCPQCMQPDACLLIYGPFNYQNRYTSDSNARFDHWLRQRDPDSGIKNFEWLQDIAGLSGLECIADYPMPANNRVLVWQKK